MCSTFPQHKPGNEARNLTASESATANKATWSMQLGVANYQLNVMEDTSMGEQVEKVTFDMNTYLWPALKIGACVNCAAEVHPRDWTEAILYLLKLFNVFL